MLFGLELEQLAVDGCITRAPCGGQTAGPSPVDRRKQGLKRSVAVEADGILLAALPAPANHRDDRLLAATVDDAPVPVRRSGDGLVELDLPAGQHRVDLRFTGARPDPLGSCSRWRPCWPSLCSAAAAAGRP